MTPRSLLGALAASVLLATAAMPAVAGPPYETDDPEPTAFRHYEIYVFTSYDRDASHAINASLPSVELNYGLMPNVQFSVTAPFAAAQSAATPFDAGFGDAEVALKVRFMQERPGRPQASFYPALVLPTGNAVLGLGGGAPKVFLPIWLQKTNGAWTYFGGGGVWRNPGPGNRDYTFTGFAATHEVREGFNVGAEVYHQSPDTIRGTASTGVAVGFTADRGQNHALLASFGRDVAGSGTFHAYAAYELYLGPAAAGKKR
ncbi:MAG: transporter [Candidatus Eremiobacteraeota bacterium]|nr:transporter [Candidatus Eremiobacteraeota bacterium]